MKNPKEELQCILQSKERYDNAENNYCKEKN